MKPLCVLLLFSIFFNRVSAQHPVTSGESLDSKQQSIVAISAFTAKGDQAQLQNKLNAGLDAGLTINEIREVLVQLYAYAGFPKSLNALNTFIAVLKEREKKGIKDPLGKESSPLPTDKSKLQFGTEMQTKLVGRPVKGEVFEFAPAIDQFLKEHLFGDIFGRDNLDWKTRELATIAALASMEGVENQLRSHYGVGMYNGLTQPQLQHLVSIVHVDIGEKEGSSAKKVLQSVVGESGKSTPTNIGIAEPDPGSLFPKGRKITNDNFIGTAWLHPMVNSDSINATQVGNVTFEPGARTKWHLHPGGQILLATEGLGYYQEKGSSKRLLRKGDVIKCPSNIPHWHGASHDSHFVQVAVTNAAKGVTVWLHPVTDEEYNSK